MFVTVFKKKKKYLNFLLKSMPSIIRNVVRPFFIDKYLINIQKIVLNRSILFKIIIQKFLIGWSPDHHMAK